MNEVQNFVCNNKDDEDVELQDSLDKTNDFEDENNFSENDYDYDPVSDLNL